MIYHVVKYYKFTKLRSLRQLVFQMRIPYSLLHCRIATKHTILTKKAKVLEIPVPEGLSLPQIPPEVAWD
jgi:hypothetical protein